MRKSILVVLMALASIVRAEDAVPTLDGVIAEGEWSGAARHALTGGGDVLLMMRNGTLYVAVRGAKRGLASLCIGDERRVAILHSSAALGTAAYARDGERWSRRADFDYELRDSPRTGAPSEDAKARHMLQWSWLANPSHTGAPIREFAIQASDARRFLAVAFVTVDEPMTIAYWPETVNDDCAALRLGQGWAGESQVFAPARWYRIGD